MHTTKILIVDDKEYNLFALDQILSVFDAEIMQTTSGHEALEWALTNEFAVALTDVHMPLMDGFELSTKLHQTPNHEFLPIIFISEIDQDQASQLHGIESGAIDFIKQPYDAKLLVGKVKRFVEMFVQRKEAQMINEQLCTLLEENESIKAEMTIRIDQQKSLYDLLISGVQSPIEALTKEIDLINATIQTINNESLTGSCQKFEKSISTLSKTLKQIQTLRQVEEIDAL